MSPIFVLIVVVHRFSRFLMLVLFVALQAMAPFLHAHAGAVQLNHGGLLHMHTGSHADAGHPMLEADAHGTEVGVAQGLRSECALSVAASAALPAAPPALLRAPQIERPGLGLPAPPTLLTTSDHHHPPALAPPSA